MPFNPGTLLGVYEIQSLIGAGGMGEVYRARDPRLNRAIAIKVLQDPVAGDPLLRERFEREAKATAALNHPNIVTIHSVEEAEGRHFLTMELVQGRTLDGMLVREGVPTDKLLEIGISLTDAAAAAHQAGITHRDLKPANVMVTTDGRVKVLDFGLAKPSDAGLLNDNDSTLATGNLTGHGTIVGTIAYMSPEQAEGKPVDHRSDIFSLGVILFEMATGERPFRGDTSLSVLAAIVRDTPRPADQINGRVPHELARIIRRCLAKDPEDRYQSAKDVRNELRELKHDLESGDVQRPVVAVRSRSPVSRLWIAGAAVLAAAAIMGWMSLGRDTAEIGPVEASFTQLTFDAGFELFPSLSPDGKWIVYAKAAAPGNTDIYLQSIGGRNAINLTPHSPASELTPIFSPDGDRIAFFADGPGGGLFVMGRTGDFTRKISDTGFTPAWSPDGKQLVVSTVNAIGTPYARTGIGELWILDVETGQRRFLYKGDAVQPQWSPHGHRIAFWGLPPGASQRDIWTISATGGEPVAATNDEPLDSNPVWSADGRFLYFSSDRSGSLNLWRIPIDERTGAVGGRPQPLATPAQLAGQLSVSRTGGLIAYTSFSIPSNIQRVELDPSTGTVQGSGRWLTTGSTYAQETDVSWDGERLVYRAGMVQEDLFVRRVDGTGVQQLTHDRARDRYPRWSPDGRHIIFYSDRSGQYELWMIGADGSGLRAVTRGNESEPIGPGAFAWAPDGQRIAGTNVRTLTDTVIFDPWKPWRDQQLDVLPPFGQPPRRFVVHAWSADGRRILGSGNGTGPVVVYDVAERRYTELTTQPGANDAFWSGESGQVVFRAGGSKVMFFDPKTRQTRELFSVEPEVMSDLSLSRDGRQMFVTRRANESDIWLATLTPTPGRH